jgi:NO-binding membrane sensor protein with MHYT domain
MPLAPFFLQLFAQTWNPLNDGTSVHRNIRPVLLWLVIATTYVTTSILLSKRILNAEGIKKPSWAVACGLGLGSTAFLFKLASTAEHSPELLSFAPLAIQESLLRLDTVNIARALLVILASTRFYVRLLSGKKMKQQGTD